jgi:hypothetical protein
MQRFAIFLTAIVTLFGIQSARADEKLDVVATFSILGDFVKNVGSDRVFVNTLVGPNGDTHVDCRDVFAQNPFGASGHSVDPVYGGVVGWLLAKQSEFYLQMSSTIRAAKSDGHAVWTLMATSFACGVFHAAGPGHGKAVISSYLVANDETARRGIALSFAFRFTLVGQSGHF